MIWNSLGDFVDMGGYGLYVWGSYGVALLVVAVELTLARKRFARALRHAASPDELDN